MLRVAVVGCGLMGERRAATARAHERSTVAAVVDVNRERAEAVAARYGGRVCPDWEPIVRGSDADVVVSCVPPGVGVVVARAALAAGKHVLLEKPMGRDLAEARTLADAARQSERVLKLGFNHRHHPALRGACARYRSGEIGRLVNVRCRYGHGGRPGFEREWRADVGLAGGGQLTDQGVHAADLIHWLHGLPARAAGFLQTAVWDLHSLEDNAFALFQYEDGVVAALHVSMTQWKNLFSFEITGENGALIVEGLGGSYGPERLIRVRRCLEGGVPETEETVFSGDDESWAAEWEEFVAAVVGGQPYSGTPEDGLAAMRMVDAVYRAAREGTVVEV